MGRRAALCDWGLCARIQPNTMLQTTRGSLFYSCPELLKRHPFNRKEKKRHKSLSLFHSLYLTLVFLSFVSLRFSARLADVWGLGVILFAMVSNKLPFMAESVRKDLFATASLSILLLFCFSSSLLFSSLLLSHCFSSLRSFFLFFCLLLCFTPLSSAASGYILLSSFPYTPSLSLSLGFLSWLLAFVIGKGNASSDARAHRISRQHLSR